MKIAQVQFSVWDKVYDFNPNNFDLEKNNYVIVKTEKGLELGKVIGFKEVNDSDFVLEDEDQGDNQKKIVKPIVRKANPSDFEKIPNSDERNKVIKYCKQMIEKFNLPMKLVDVHFSFDGSRITFAFIADGRIDFRELVKDLTSHFNKTIRLHQIGIRDEAKLCGDCGPCGRQLCCRTFLNDLTSITSDMAEKQKVAHRGSDRISGICGRLMCCLAYEQKGYEESEKKLPPIGARVNVDGKRGVVLSHNLLKESVDVEFDAENGEGKTIAEIDINRNKKK